MLKVARDLILSEVYFVCIIVVAVVISHKDGMIFMHIYIYNSEICFIKV